MNSLSLSAGVILPLAIILGIGYLLRRIHLVDESALNIINRLIFYLFLPLMLFRTIYECDLSVAMDPEFLIYSAVSIIASVLLLLLIVPRIEKENSKRGVMIQGIFRSNGSIYGIPIASAMMAAEDLGLMAMLITIAVLLYNGLAVFVLERFRGGKADIKKILMGILKNPSIIAVFVGLLLRLLSIELPEILYKPINSLASVTTPLGFLVLGGSFTFASAHKNRRQLIIIVGGKLILMPLLWTGIAILMGWRGAPLLALLILTSAPTALSSFSMAKEMEGDGALAGEAVVFTSVISILTIFLWIFAYSAWGLI